jgi:Cupin domain
MLLERIARCFPCDLASCGRPPKHVHSREEEGFYVIEGQVEFRAGHIDEVLTKDTFIASPRGIPHAWINTTTSDAKLITFTAGAGNEGFFLTLGASGVGPAGPRATLRLPQINARTQRYGVTYMARQPSGRCP